MGKDLLGFVEQPRGAPRRLLDLGRASPATGKGLVEELRRLGMKGKLALKVAP